MLIDSHCHLPDPKYEIPAEDVVKEAQEAGVDKLITVGTSLENNKEIVEFSSGFNNVFSTVGVYPHEDIGENLGEIGRKLRKNFQYDRAHKIVGIGECGIDLPALETDYPTRELDEQRELFKLHIGLALQKDLPLVIHNRNGDYDVLEILEKYRDTNLKGVMHCFTSTWDYAKQILDLGFYISFTAIITYPSAKNLHEVVKNVPRNRFLVETDAPLLPPQGYRGQTNYPKYVKIIAEKIAEIRNSSIDEISNFTYKNTCDLFCI